MGSASLKVTTKTLALELGVSQRTVSEALNNPDNRIGLKEETIIRIRKHAEKRGYRPNSAARDMRYQRIPDIGLLLAEREDTGSATILEGTITGMVRMLQKNGRSLRIAKMTDGDLEDPQIIRNLLRDWGVAGIVINYIHDEPERFRELIKRCQLPFIWINNRRQADCVVPDDRAAAGEVIRRFLSMGYRRPAYINFQESHHFSTVERREGAVSAMEEGGLVPLTGPLLPGLNRTEQVRGFKEWWENCHEKPDALLIYNVYSAMVVEDALHAMGQTDVRRVFFHTSSFLPLSPNVSVVVLDSWRMGEMAVTMLEEKLQQPERRLPPRVIPSRLPGLVE
ncbi:MAG: LacI family DNA-binding transcriptional regulator [Opitutales bacterium]|nr:LacI family DNA-binding transcriptional regulator [Opitutales bacterium]